jgi:hypothetical protein
MQCIVRAVGFRMGGGDAAHDPLFLGAHKDVETGIDVRGTIETLLWGFCNEFFTSGSWMPSSN